MGDRFDSGALSDRASTTSSTSEPASPGILATSESTGKKECVSECVAPPFNCSRVKIPKKCLQDVSDGELDEASLPNRQLETIPDDMQEGVATRTKTETPSPPPASAGPPPPAPAGPPPPAPSPLAPSPLASAGPPPLTSAGPPPPASDGPSPPGSTSPSSTPSAEEERGACAFDPEMNSASALSVDGEPLSGDPTYARQDTTSSSASSTSSKSLSLSLQWKDGRPDVTYKLEGAVSDETVRKSSEGATSLMQNIAAMAINKSSKTSLDAIKEQNMFFASDQMKINNKNTDKRSI